MKSPTFVNAIRTGVMVGGLFFSHPFSVPAQEATPAQQEKPAAKMGMPGMMGHKHMMTGMMPEMEKMHAQMEKMHQEMMQELRKQMAALREHTKAMEGISDEKQLLAEMKKHQQMTDTFLATMLEQHEKMHAQMKGHHEQMRRRMGEAQAPEKQGPSEHETHHGEEEETHIHQRQHEVAQRGATIMPFDLSRTTHVFDDQADGGLQTVTANDPSDTAQIYLIRDHLVELANRFARGNFADQAWLHGSDMPGLAELSAGYKKLKITYHVLPTGASLHLASDDPAIATAIHKYFAAQRSDHAAHGEMMHHH